MNNLELMIAIFESSTEEKDDILNDLPIDLGIDNDTYNDMENN